MEYNKYVGKAQNQLIDAGYSVGIYGADGKFGARTLQAVDEAISDALQGVGNQKDITETIERYPFAYGLEYGDKGDEVRKLQKLLCKWHMEYYLGEALSDGIFGDGTKEAVIEFQKGMSQKPDGKVMEAVWNLLNLEPIDISYWSTPQASENKKEDRKMPLSCNCNGKYCDSENNALPGRTSVGLMILIERIQSTLKKRFGRDDILVRLTDDMDLSNATDRNGGNRCKTWNIMHGGAEDSQHTKWRAADLFLICPRIDNISSPTVQDLWEVADGMNTFGGVGKYVSNIHVDSRGARARW